MSDQSRKRKLPYFSDVTLFKRVDKYLDDNIDRPTISKDAMVEELRDTYKEYQRRNKSVFRMAVFKAYNMINENILEVTQERSVDGSDVEAIEDTTSQAGTDSPAPTPSAPTIMESYLQGLHKMASPAAARQKNANSELINISSDEGEEEPRSKRALRLPNNRHPQQHYSDPVKQHTNKQNSVSSMLSHGLRMINSALPNVNVQQLDRKAAKEDTRQKKAQTQPAISIYPAGKKQTALSLPHVVPETCFSDFGGYPKVLKAVSDLVLHFYNVDIYTMLGVTPPRGFILHGPPGCGKTLLAHAVAGELNLPLVKVSGPELIGGISGESEERIRKIFLQAKQQVPCVLFIDEIDVISQRRANATKDMERRVVSQLIVCLDDLGTSEEGDELIVIGATNKVDELDPGLRRAGRFDKEVCIGIPDRKAREGILTVICRRLKMSSEISIEKIAELTPGYVAADLKSLITDAAAAAVNRIFALKKKQATPVDTAVLVENNGGKVEGVPMVVDEPKGPEAEEAKVEGDVLPENKSEDKTDQDMEGEASKAQDGETLTKETEPSAPSVGEGDGAKPPEEANAAEPSEKRADETEEPMEVTEVDDSSRNIADDTTIQILNGPVEDDVDSVVIIEDGNEPETAAKDNSTGPSKSKTEKTRPRIQIEMPDLLAALKTTQPSAKREGFATVPDVTWDDIGSLKDVRNELTMSIMMPVKYPEEFARMGIDVPSGIMLWGPPGCGKTLLAKAIANEANINFISVKGPELLNMYVGESEKAVRTCFERARNSQPCVIFFDEIDALCPRRSDSSEGSVSSRVVNQVLTEMDGVEGRHGVYLMAASNRPDMVDPAVLRPGRLDKIVKVGLPNSQDRVDILKAITKNGTKPPLHTNVSLEKIGSSPDCDGYSGADLAALVKEASVLALTEYLSEKEATTEDKKPGASLFVDERHFRDALKKIKPSVHTEERQRYERLERSFSSLGALP